MNRSPIGRTLPLLLLLTVLAACGSPSPGASSPAAEVSSAASAEPAASVEVTASAEPASAEPASAAAGEAVSPAETLIFSADLSDQISLDPAYVYEFGGIQVVGNIYETLVSFDPGDPTIKPLLAKEWEIEQTADGSTLTFTLDETARFASGNPVTAEDVVWSWSRALDLNQSPVFLFVDIAQLTKENMRAVDAQTLEVKLPNTASPQVFLSILSFTLAAVLDSKLVQENLGSDNGHTWLDDNSAGSGPYVLERWERNAQNTLALNPNFWREAPPIKRVIMRNIGELANLQSAIETGEADIVQDLGAEQIAALEGNADIEIVKASSTLLVYLGMNAKSAPLDNPDVREAIRYAINYDEIVNNLLGGNAELVQEIIPKGLFGHTGEVPFTQDIAKAKELLAKAGVAEGTEIELTVPTAQAPGGVEWGIIAAKIQSDVEQIGLTLNIQQVQQSELLNAYRAQNLQMVLINWGPDFPDPDGNVTPFTDFGAESIAWRNEWDSPEVAELAKQAALETDETVRADLYKQLTERVLHEGPYAILYQPTRAFGVRSNIEGFAYDAVDTPSISFWLISKQP